MEEKKFYNAIAIAARGNYEKTAKCQAAYGSWRVAYENRKGIFGPTNVAEAWEKMEKFGIRLILLDDSDYPPLLKEIPQPPFGIYVLGNLQPETCHLPLAIVGTRRATPDGKAIAKRFARELAAAGFAIVSGLAFGIDAAAHEGCLAANGKTIAVLAGGLDDIYPQSNKALGEKILANGGAIVSEYPLGQPAYKERFLERNRIVSGLSQGTLVIEAPEQSGSLVTARHAFEQNRNLFVIPGSITHPNFRASHELIRQGAELVTKPEHIVEAYGIVTSDKSRVTSENATEEEKLILEALRNIGGPAEVDKLADITKLEPQAVNQILTFLLVKNLIKEAAGGYVIG